MLASRLCSKRNQSEQHGQSTRRAGISSILCSKQKVLSSSNRGSRIGQALEENSDACFFMSAWPWSPFAQVRASWAILWMMSKGWGRSLTRTPQGQIGRLRQGKQVIIGAPGHKLSARAFIHDVIEEGKSATDTAHLFHRP